MPRPLPTSVRQWADDPSLVVFLVTVPLCLLRAIDQPSVGVGSIDVTVADVSLAATGVLALRRLRARRRLPAPPLLAAMAVFVALLLVSALPNGGDALSAAAKIALYSALALGAIAFLDSAARVRVLLGILVLWAGAATAWAAIGFVTSDRGRQASFMGEHDMAALATLAAAIGLARLHGRRGHPGWIAVAGLAAGLVGTVLAASLASLLGLYLASVIVLVIATRHRELRLTAAALTVAIAVAATGGTLALRQGELGFLQEWFGTPTEGGGSPASWSQRLIYSYIGGRIFLDNPVLGTGWHGLLPPEEFARYVPDARERYPDQPYHYFPPSDQGFIPQQTYDQILFELGLVGAALFVVLAGIAVWRAAVAARRRSGERAYLPAAWLGALAGALAGAALFGGSPLTAMLWLTLGLVAVESDPETA
jgi:O-antigen ligase